MDLIKPSDCISPADRLRQRGYKNKTRAGGLKFSPSPRTDIILVGAVLFKKPLRVPTAGLILCLI
jgi:hypothetical protein